jgi:hypothetical protein
MEVLVPADQVVLMTSIRVSGAIGVVLENEDVAANTFFFETLLGPGHETFEDPLSGFVMGDDVLDAVALRCGVLGVRSHIEVEAGPVLQKDVGRPSP